MPDRGNVPGRTPLELALLLCAPLLAAVLALRPVDNFDLGFHLRLGELVLTHGIPVTDPFSYPGEGQPWALEQWLGPAAFALAWRAFGIAGCIVLKAVVVFFAFLCVALAARAVSRGPIAPAVATLLAAVSASVRFNVQPGIFSTLGLGLVLLALARATAARDVRPAWPLLLLFALWPHVHPGYLTGLVVLSAFAAGVVAEAALTGREGGGLRARLLAARAPGAVGLLVACGAVAVASLVIFHPLHGAALARVLALFRSSVIQANIAEFAPLWRSYSVNAPVLVLLALPPAGWLLLRKVTPLPLAVAFVILSIESLRVGRLVGEASMAAALVWAPAAELLADRVARGGHLARLGAVLGEARLGALVLAVSAAAAGLHLASPESRPLDWTDGYYPRSCYEWIERNQLPPRAFNDLGFGGSWIFHFGTSRKTFIDGRSFYSDDFFVNDYTPIKQARPGFREIAHKWGIEWYLLHPSRFRALHEVLLRDPGMKLAHLETNCAIYVRRSQPLPFP